MVSEYYKRSDSNSVAKKNSRGASEVGLQSPTLVYAIPIEKHHKPKKVIEEFQSVDSRTLWNDGNVQFRAAECGIRIGEVGEPLTTMRKIWLRQVY